MFDIQQFNGNKYLLGISMLLLNLGSKYLVFDLSKTQEDIIKGTIFRRITIFSLFYIGTRDIIVSCVLTACFIIMTIDLWPKKKNISSNI
jgi:hypothetical protein